MDRHRCQNDDDPTESRAERPASQCRPEGSSGQSHGGEKAIARIETTSLRVENVDSIQEGQIIAEHDEKVENLQLETGPASLDALPGAPVEGVEAATASRNPSKVEAALGTAFNEAVHFAKGLVSHPDEATKHIGSSTLHRIGILSGTNHKCRHHCLLGPTTST